MTPRPLVLVSACTKVLNQTHYYTAQQKYVDAVLIAGDCMPVILPALQDKVDFDALFANIDGVMITGATSNLDPDFYGQSNQTPDAPQDKKRDNTDIPLITEAIKRGVPIFGICRGIQEINVTLGGTLHQAIHTLPGMLDHRFDDNDPEDVQYEPSHTVSLNPEGHLFKLLDKNHLKVNSLHGQGVATLAPGLQVEAVAEDGLIEAISIKDAPYLSMAVQWHPEWKVLQNPDSVKIFKAFGDACKAHQQERLKRDK